MTDDTLKQARELVQVGRSRGGITCPCCGLLNRERSSRLCRPNVVALVVLYVEHHKAGWDQWVHLGEKLRLSRLQGQLSLDGADRGNGDWYRLRFWGLIEGVRSNTDPTAPSTGRHARVRMTPLGKSFVEGLEALPERIITFDNKLVRFDGNPVTVSDALGTPFNLVDVLGEA
jgi:hypothetical protein